MTGARLDEQTEIAKVTATLVAQVLKDYQAPGIKRDAHPKMHGCVQAEFEVDRALPQDLRHGIFGQAQLGHTYMAWIRFSNAFHIQHDLELETRGMAVKLLDAPARNLVDDDGLTQDFLFATHDVFFLPNVDNYREFAEAADAGPGKIARFFVRHRLFRGFLAMAGSIFMIVRNPLAIPYFSQTPYALGPNLKVKLKVEPRVTRALKRSLPGRIRFGIRMAVANLAFIVFEARRSSRLLSSYSMNKGSAEDFCDRYVAPRDYLRLAMMSFLCAHDAWFDVFVQLQPGADSTFIEDATKRWRSEFTHVATIRIPRQVFWPELGMPDKIRDVTTEMMDLGENMSFNPWHALPDHEPLGAINRARRIIYKKIADTRQTMNSLKPPAPPPPAPVPIRAQDDRLKPTRAQYDRIKNVSQFGQVT